MRPLLLAVIIFFLAGSQLHGHRENEPWHYLEKGITGLGVEQGFYRLHAFIPDRNVDTDLLAQMSGYRTDFIETGHGDSPGSGGWSAGRSGEPGYMMIRVGGDSPEECRLTWVELQRAVDCSGTSCGLAWSVETYVDGHAFDLDNIGLEMLDRLGATMLDSNSYNGTLQILGHVPWHHEYVDLAEGPVNLDIELFYEPYRQQIRMRIGVPVLITAIFY